ncbi:hypothetical protein Tco_1493682 [Tanacetum coccineum]
MGIWGGMVGCVDGEGGGMCGIIGRVLMGDRLSLSSIKAIALLIYRTEEFYESQIVVFELRSQSNGFEHSIQSWRCIQDSVVDIFRASLLSLNEQLTNLSPELLGLLEVRYIRDGVDDHARTFSSLLLAEVDKRNLNPLKQIRTIEQLRQ